MDRTVCVWDLKSGRLERTLGEKGRGAGALAVTADGRRVMTASPKWAIGYYDEACDVGVWDLASGRLERSLVHQSMVYSVAVTPDGRRLVSMELHRLHVWDVETGAEVTSWTPDPAVKLCTCCTAPGEDSLIVCGDSSGGIHVLRLLEDRVEPAGVMQPAAELADRRRFGFPKR